MKILMYSTHEHERTYAEEWAKETGNQVTMEMVPLTKETVAMAKGYDGVSVQQTSRIDEEVYRALHELGIKQISTRTAGVDMFDLQAAVQNGITITNVAIYSPRAIAEMGVTHAMYLLRNIGRFNQRMDNDYDFRWSGDLIAKEIYTCTVGLIGAGHIGGATAQIYRALGARVIAFDRHPDPELAPYMEYVDFETVLKESDILSLHVPLLPSTEKMIDAAAIAKMKDNAILINMARGGLVDTQALIDALNSGRLGGAGLDTLADETTYFGKQVDAEEVPDDYHELEEMPNVVITPHVAFFTNVAVRNMVRISLDDVVAVIKGQRTKNIVK